MIKISKSSMKDSSDNVNSERKSNSRTKDILVGSLAGGSMGTVGALGLGLTAMSRGRNASLLSESDADEMIDNFSRRHNMASPTIVTSKKYAYLPDLPEYGAYSDSVLVPNRNSIHSTVLAHELGHAKRYNARGLAKKRSSLIFRHPMLVGLGSIGGAILATSDDEKMRDASPYITALPALPTLYDEAVAWKDGIRYLKDSGRWARLSKMDKFRPALALGSYASSLVLGPVAGTLIAKRMTEKRLAMKNSEADDRNERG